MNDFFSPLRRHLLIALAAAPFTSVAKKSSVLQDPLPSWNETPTKRAILEFVAAVSRPGGPDRVERDDRIAVFDNDGTLWCEKPAIEGLFTRARIEVMLTQRPELARLRPSLALLVNHDDGDREELYREPDNASLEAARTYAFRVISMRNDWHRVF